MEMLLSFLVGGVAGAFIMGLLNAVSYRKGRQDGIAETLQAIYAERTPHMIRSLLREIRDDV